MNQAIAEFCIRAYTLLLPIAWFSVAVTLFILVPLAMFPSTRPIAGNGIVIASFIFGITTWFLGATVTFLSWGWVGLLIGLLLFGIGVVPIGILAAFISLGEPTVGITLIVMVFITFGARGFGVSLLR